MNKVIHENQPQTKSLVISGFKCMYTLNTVCAVDISISQRRDMKNEKGYIEINEWCRENKARALP